MCFFGVLFVVLLGFYPDNDYFLGTTLLIPGSLALILMSIRGSYYAFNSNNKESKLSWSALYGITGLLITASLSVALVISEDGYIDDTSTGIDLNFIDLIFSTYGC